MFQGKSVLSGLMMGWMVLIFVVLGYRQASNSPQPQQSHMSSPTQTVWLR